MSRSNEDAFSSDHSNMDMSSKELCSTYSFIQEQLSKRSFNTEEQMIIKNNGRLTRLLSEDESVFKNIQFKNILTTDEKGKLENIQDHSEKTKKLLELIQNKGPEVFNEFLTMLKEDMVNESRREHKQWSTTVETYSCSSDVNGGKPEIKKWMVNVNSTSGSPDANVSSNPPKIGNPASKETNVSSTLPNAGNQTTKDTNVSRNPPEDGNALIKDNEQFLKNNRAALIQKVKNVVEITDDLKLISAEQRSKIQAGETDQDKMRLLLNNTTSKAAAKDLVDALLQHAKDVMDDLINAQ